MKLLPSGETKPEESLACVDAAQELFVTYPYKFSPKGIGMTSYSMLAGKPIRKSSIGLKLLMRESAGYPLGLGYEEEATFKRDKRALVKQRRGFGKAMSWPRGFQAPFFRVLNCSMF